MSNNCDNINCNHNDTKGLCCLFNPENCKYRQLQKENAELKELLDCENCCELEESECESCAEFGHFKCKGKAQLTKAKEIMNIAIKGIKHWGIVGGTERPFEKQAEKLFNLFLDKAEQFLKEE